MTFSRTTFHRIKWQLQFSYSSVTVQLQFSYSSVTVQLQFSYSSVTVQLQFSYSSVTVQGAVFTTVHILKNLIYGPSKLKCSISLGRKGLPGTNTLAYYEKSVNYGCKKFYSTGPNVIKLFFP